MTPPEDDPRPVPPPRPTSADCCRGGCDPCVFDLYDAALERYEAELAAWRHAERGGVAASTPAVGPRAKPRADAPRQRSATPGGVAVA